MQRRRFSREFKIEAVKLVRERGVSAAQTERGDECLNRVKLSSRVGRHRLPLSPLKKTSSGRSGKSVSCQTRKWLAS